MRKQKNSQNRNYKISAVIISLAVLLNLRFPIQFMGDMYKWTGTLYIVVGLVIALYGIWLFLVRRIRYLAIFMLLIATITTFFNFTEIERSGIYDCEPENKITLVCSYVVSITYPTYRLFPDGTASYLAISSVPVGIQLNRFGLDLLMLF